MAEKLLTVREVAQSLGISEKDVIQLSEQGKIPAYKIGGVYLRFKREQIERLRPHFQPRNVSPTNVPSGRNIPSGPLEQLSDFIYFNDFYIFCAIIIIALVIIILKGL